MLFCAYGVNAMILWLSGRLADALVAGGAIALDDRDIYVYGLDVLLSSAVNFICILGVGALIGKFPETALYMIMFMALRSAAGGYHADTHFACFLITLIAYGLAVVALILLPAAAVPLCSLVFALFSLAVVLAFAPAPHENRPVSAKERVKFRRLSICIAVAGACAAAALLLMGAQALAIMVSLGMLCSAMSLIAVRIKLGFVKGQEATNQ